MSLFIFVISISAVAIWMCRDSDEPRKDSLQVVTVIVTSTLILSVGLIATLSVIDAATGSTTGDQLEQTR